ncbi:BgTH12-05378 [Blumeria graminis f. sp. triticale]|uniref:BgtAcSP-31400 n=3 Tax=Blumeria graminis TaxID=34373 RepID=A0A9X9MHP7_BLUGR|nr:hypothetical protein BGT96224_AcSP31400 [Blumeria graminis f. sp. tritici 96224]CAD6502788.1 BgTH12-05378 [Blumeria graminis f. sp. triticale]VDB88270.1 BgtAcSP-31400 [Blumeria graminis f. sp. tritici]
MACVVAFFLKTSAYSLSVNQIVLVANNPYESMYKIYDPIESKFPTVNGDIKQTDVEVKDLGTYISVYCSKTLKSRDIFDKVGREMVDLKLHLQNNLFPPADILHQCLDTLANLDNRLHNNYLPSLFQRSIPWSKIDSYYCPPKIVAQLALKYGLTVVGKYKNLFPTNNEKGITIDADKQFHLWELVNDGVAFRGRNWSTNSVALAWYQGQPHLFQWREEHGWLPLTLIGAEHQNAAMLYYYVLGDNHEIWNTHNHLSTKIKNILKSAQWQEHEKRVISQVVSGSRHSHLNLETVQGRLESIRPIGSIGA